jgi:tRNA(Arg) A34 adenosine deaminase TadA
MRGEERRQTVFTRRSIVVASAALPLASRAFAKDVQSPATQEDERLMKLVLAEGAKGDFPFGTVIVRDGEVLMSGRNLGIKEQDPTAHGEMVAIRRFLAQYGPEKGTTLYTSGEPCAMCMGAILWCGIGRLVFAASVDLTVLVGRGGGGGFGGGGRDLGGDGGFARGGSRVIDDGYRGDNWRGGVYIGGGGGGYGYCGAYPVGDWPRGTCDQF